MKILTISVLFCFTHLIKAKDSGIQARQAPTFSSTGSHYSTIDQNDPAGQSPIVYDTLGNKRPESYTNPVIGIQQGKSNSFGSSYATAAADNSVSGPGGYSAPFPSPAAQPPVTYIPNRPTLESRPNLVVSQPAVKPDETYAYYYQHYPAAAPQSHQQYGTSSQPYAGSSNFGGLFDTDFFGSGTGQGLNGLDFGGGSGLALGGLGGGLGGLALAGLATLAKGALALKPLLVIGFLLLLLLPIIILFLPIPIVTIPTPAGRDGREVSQFTTGAAQVTSALTSLTHKILNSEECLERVVCKIPSIPGKYKKEVKGFWAEYGSRLIPSPGKLSRGLEAYFKSDMDMSPTSRADHCNQKFKCSKTFF